MQVALDSAIADNIGWELASYAGNLVNIKRELGDDEAALQLAQEALNRHRAKGHRIASAAVIGPLLRSCFRAGAASASGCAPCSTRRRATPLRPTAPE